MEVWTHPNYHFLLLSRGPSWLLGSVRFLSPCVCSQFRLRSVFRFEFSMGSHSSPVSPVMTTRKGRSITVSGEPCKVFWMVEADLEAGQLLYLSGDLVALGCWQPDLSVLMHRSEQTRLWKAEVEIPAGVHFKYNYFIKDENCPSFDVIWRPGPEFSLVVPANSKRSRDVTVRDSWVKFDPEKPPAHLWGSWIEEMYPSKQLLITSPVRDEDINHLNVAIKEPKLFQKDLKVNGNRCFDGEIVAANHSDSDSVLSERQQPIEEPWLLQRSIIFATKKEEVIMNLSDIEDEVDEAALSLDDDKRYSKDEDVLLPADGNTLSLKGDSVSTEILINSSLCTMQRIAVLENRKLVELLLEPVKADVQCDSVYLGVVTKFVPHMGGAFVDIGASRPSLMDIKQNREPFIFPPFRKRKDNVVISSVLQNLEENLATAESEQTSNDVDDVDVTSQTNLVVPVIHDDDDEVDDDFETSEIKENVNGSIVNHSGGSADFENFLNGIEHHLGDKSSDDYLGIETEGSHSKDTAMKDAKHSSLNERKWDQVQKGTKTIVQVVKEGLGTKGPTLTAYPKLRSRFWILSTRCDRIGVSKKISGVERTRLKVIAKTLQPQGFGLTVRTVAAGHSLEELQKDLEGLLSTWKNIIEHAKSAALAADEGVEGAIPVILHMAMGQTLSVVQDYFNEKVKRMVVDSARTYHEVTNYLQDIAPDLCDRVELYNKRIPLFDEFNIEEEIDNLLSKRVPLATGGSLVIEQTEALVSIDVNGGHVMFGQGTSQEKAILDVNLAAAKQIARELRLRDIGGIIVVDFIDMADDSNKRLVYEEMKREVERDRSTVKVSELSKHGLMEITRKRVRPSVTFMISEPCTCCHATGRVEALETSFSKIEQEICRLLAKMNPKAVPENPKTWPRFILRVDHHMCEYLTSGKRTRLAILSSSLKVWILLKVARGFTRGAFEVKLFTDEQVNKHAQQAAISLLPRAETRSTKSSSTKLTLVPIKKGKSKGR